MSKKLTLRDPALPRTQSSATHYVGPSGFQGAGYSPNRGYVYWPTLDTRREIDTYSRTEIMRKVRYLYGNVGLVRRIINGLSRMVAGNGLKPISLNGDREWNKEADAAFAARSATREVFDLSQKYNFARSQRAVLRHRFKDGDMGVMPTSSQTGRSRFCFYESHQIATPSKLPPAERDQWFDGVRVGRYNQPVQFGLLDAKGQVTRLPRENFWLFCEYERSGQQRGLSILHAAINKLIDIGEVNTALTLGIKSSARQGYYIHEAATKDPAPAGGLAAAFGPKRTETLPSGQTVTIEEVYGDGGEIPELPAGKELKLLHDPRPHPNTLGFLEFLLRDIAWGTGLSVDLLWNIASLGGANTRYVMADAQSFLEEQQQELVDLYCSRVWVYTIAKEIKYGNLRMPSDPEWWKHGWITPARQTVDFGRDGKLHLEQHKQRMLTLSRFYGWQGLDWKPEVDQWLDEVQYTKQGMEARGLDHLDIRHYAPVPGAPANEPPPAESEE